MDRPDHARPTLTALCWTLDSQRTQQDVVLGSEKRAWRGRRPRHEATATHLGERCS